LDDIFLLWSIEQLSDDCELTWFDQPFTLDELTYALQHKENTTSGIDKISYEILKQLSISSFVILCRILNNLWLKSLIPDSWHHYKITPIPKKNSLKLRPIALASCIRKLVDSILNERLIHWLEIHNVMPHYFYGFRSGRSTVDAVTQLVMDINQSFLNKQHLIAAFLDIEAAYPRVHLPTLSTIMSQLGLSSHFNQYITSMFINENISISSSAHTLHRNVYRGLPQGFPLSPTLYNIYSLNFIPHHTSETK